MKLVSAHPWHLLAGLVIWAVWFVIVYGGQGLACSIKPPSVEQGVFNWVNLSLLLLTFIVASYLAVCATLSWRLTRTAKGHQRRFALHVATALYVFAAVATLAVGIPLLGLEPCI